jgi:hypothetical protein
MATLKVALYWTCKTPEGSKRYPAAIGRNGKIRPRFAQVVNAQVFFESGHYECRYTAETGKTAWKSVGEDASAAELPETQSRVNSINWGG